MEILRNVLYTLSDNLFKESKIDQRKLKGGGSSGGSGSSSGGSYRPRGNNYGNNTGGRGGRISTAVIIAILVTCLSIASIFLYCYCKKSKEKEAHEQAVARDFEERVNSLRDDNEKQYSTRGEQNDSKPVSGNYIAEYIDRGESRISTVTLIFTDVEGRYKISGSSKDIDGTTSIEEGYACYDGSSAYWKENYTSGYVGLQVVNNGTFNFDEGTFSGEWSSNSNQNGLFTSFKLISPLPTAPSDDIPEKSFQDEPDIEVGPNAPAEPSLFDQMMNTKV